MDLEFLVRRDAMHCNLYQRPRIAFCIKRLRSCLMLPIRSLPRVAKWTNNSGYVCNSCAQKLRLGTVSTTSAKSASESAGRPFEHQQRRWVSRNYIRRLAEAEQDVQQRARDIGGGSKRSLFDVLEERGYVNQTIGYESYHRSLVFV